MLKIDNINYWSIIDIQNEIRIERNMNIKRESFYRYLNLLCHHNLFHPKKDKVLRVNKEQFFTKDQMGIIKAMASDYKSYRPRRKKEAAPTEE